MNKVTLFEILINVMSAYESLLTLICIVSTFIGVFIFANALIDAGRDEQQGQGELTQKLFLKLTLGALLCAPVFVVQLLGNSALGTGYVVTSGGFMYEGAGMSEQQKLAMEAIFKLCVLVGMVAITRAWMLANAIADRRQGNFSWGKVITWLLGGVGMVYLDGLLKFLGDATGFQVLDYLLL